MAELAAVTDQDFEADVLNSDKPVLVDFWAEWCGPCKQTVPIMQDLAEQYGNDVKIVKMDVDENPATAGRYGIRAIPTILAFKGGEVIEQLQGTRSKTDFEAAIKNLL